MKTLNHHFGIRIAQSLALGVLLHWGSVGLMGQISSPTIGVPVRIWAQAATPASGQLIIYGTFMPSTPTANDGYAESSPTYAPEGPVSLGVVKAEQGKSYTVYGGGAGTATDLFVVAPPGYQVVMDGLVRTKAAFSAGVVTFTVRKSSLQHPSLAGVAYSVSNSGVEWHIPLGVLSNGQSAGTLSLVDSGLGDDWTSIANGELLQCEPTSSEVLVTRSSGLISSVYAPQTGITVWRAGSWSRISCFEGGWDQYGSWGTQGNQNMRYTIELGPTLTSLKFTRETQTSSIATVRTEVMTLERTGTYPNFTWTKSDWTELGQSSLKQVISVNSTASPGRVESVVAKVPGGSTAVALAREYTALGCGEMMTSETLGTNQALRSDFGYFDNPGTEAGVLGYLKSAALGTGGWTAYEYYNPSNVMNASAGRLKRQFKPYLNSPSTVSTDPTQGEVVYYEYTFDEYGMPTRVGLIETRINNVVTGKTSLGYAFNGYFDLSAPIWGWTYSISKAEWINGSDSLSSQEKRFYSSTGHPLVRGQLWSKTLPNGTRTSYVYQKGTWNGTTFTSDGTSTYTRIIAINGVVSPGTETYSYLTSYGGSPIDPLFAIVGKSTMEIEIKDLQVKVIRRESYIYTSGGWVRVDYTDYTYDIWKHQISATSSRGVIKEASYATGFKTSETDESGVSTSYSYDQMGRVSASTRSGYAGIGALTTSYTYNAIDQVLTQTRSGWDGTSVQATSTYDDAGRISTETPAGLGSSSHTYNVTNRTHTTTRPDGGTVIDENYRDGRPASQTGTGVVSQYFTHGTETDGRIWARVDTGTSSSPRWKKSWNDWLGRNIKTEGPGFTGQANKVEEAIYDATTGLLTKTTKAGYAPTRFEYDVFGRQRRSGLDVNDNGLVNASSDRITESESYFESYDSAWWWRTDQKKYTNTGSGTATLTSIKRSRLTGYPANRISEIRITDVEGNVTVETIDISRSSRTKAESKSRIGLSNANVTVSVNGFPVRNSDFDGLVVSTEYDSLLRPKVLTDSRGNTTTYGYYSGSDLKEWVKDGTNQTVASYGYDTSGRVVWQADALNYLTRTSYTTRGQVYRQWGSGTYPVEYGYDSTYGDRTTQSTFRGGTGWDGSTWPGSPGTADTTTWGYDGPSGLMTSKTDALSRATLYTYNVRGQLATREWARLVSSGPSTGQRVKTTYSYNATAGEQTAIDYNDNLTTGLTYTYNRMGQAEYITDVTGVRQFEYCTPCGVVLSETLDSTYFGGRKLTYKRDQATTGRLGQGIGYQLGTASAPASDQEVTYLYENLNRLTGLTTGFANNSSTRTFRYGYEPDSALLKTLAVEGSPFLVTRSYESDRDYLTSIETKGNSPIETYVRYEYTYDERGQRKTALQAGTAYADYGNSTYRRFSYNGRGELTAALGYMGTDVTQTTDYLPGRQFEYAFDNIGNRQWSNRTGVSSLRDDYTTNALNQYTGRENNTVSISGTATSDAIVAVNGRNVTTGRRGRFWSDEVTVSNVLGPWRGPLSVYAAKPSGGNDVLRLDSRTSQLPPIAEALTYDDDGNPASDGFWTYQWDAENRLIRMETTTVAQTAGVPHRILEFQYDYLGRRVQKRVIDGATSQEISCRRLVYQGWDVIGEYAAAGGTSFGALIRTYTWGLDIARSLADAGGVGALLQISDHASGKSYLPAYDGNGNIATLSNAATGALAAVYEYTPFGESIRTEILDSALTDQPFRFSTKWTDDETGLVYYGRRYYDPRNGRFVGRDPVAEKGGLNLYGFVTNNSTNRWDILGMMTSVEANYALEQPGAGPGKYWTKYGYWGIGSAYADEGMSYDDVVWYAGLYLKSKQDELDEFLDGDCSTCWSTYVSPPIFQPVHQMAIDKALGNISSVEREILKSAVKYADGEQFQLPELQYRHAMRDGRLDENNNPRQTEAQARAESNRFVRERLLEARRLVALGTQNDRHAAIWEVGLAIHTLQDSTSPAHRGWKPWGGPDSTSATKHVFMENIYPENDAELLAVTQRIWQYFIEGGELPDDFFPHIPIAGSPP